MVGGGDASVMAFAFVFVFVFAVQVLVTELFILGRAKWHFLFQQ